MTAKKSQESKDTSNNSDLKKESVKKDPTLKNNLKKKSKSLDITTTEDKEIKQEEIKNRPEEKQIINKAIDEGELKTKSENKKEQEKDLKETSKPPSEKALEPIPKHTKEDLIVFIKENVQNLQVKISGAKEEEIAVFFQKFSEKDLYDICSYGSSLLQYLIDRRKLTQQDLSDLVKKLTKFSNLISPQGPLQYFTLAESNFILSKFDKLEEKKITENNVLKIVDKQFKAESIDDLLKKEDFLEYELRDLGQYLLGMQYPKETIIEIYKEIRKDPKKLDSFFNAPFYNILEAPEILRPLLASSKEDLLKIVKDKETEELIKKQIESLKEDIEQKRKDSALKIVEEIKKASDTCFKNEYDKIYLLIHPDRLAKILKIIQSTISKDKERAGFMLEWFFLSYLLSSIEVKVEHWQMSAKEKEGLGVYKAGIDFSRYDNIVNELSSVNLVFFINEALKTFKDPAREKISLLAKALIAKTGHDENLYVPY